MVGERRLMTTFILIYYTRTIFEAESICAVSVRRYKLNRMHAELLHLCIEIALDNTNQEWIHTVRIFLICEIVLPQFSYFQFRFSFLIYTHFNNPFRIKFCKSRFQNYKAKVIFISFKHCHPIKI